MNERDSETIAGILGQQGYGETRDKSIADLVVINTCSIRDNADKRFFGTLGQWKKHKESHPDFLICVCGCMMQQDHIVDQIKEKYPWVDVVFGTLNIDRLPDLLEEAREQQNKTREIFQERSAIVENLPVQRQYQHKALVNIMHGCNNFCTYCIVPYTRGREKSRDPKDILKEVETVLEGGAKEITLLGQNVNSYRFGSVDFTGLIYRLDELKGLERIRFMTSHPKDVSDGLIGAFSHCDSLAKHIHLPVQAGSNRVLKRMNRKYTRESYLETVAKFRKQVPDIAITTDIIVGFPGEEEEDFEQTLDLVREVGFDSAFTFLYSIRRGTPAAQMKDQVSSEIKKLRFNKLVAVVNEMSLKKNKAMEGKTLPVLVDSLSKKNEKNLSGRTEGFKLVDFPGSEEDIGQIISVKILEGKTFSLVGEKI